MALDVGRHALGIERVQPRVRRLARRDERGDGESIRLIAQPVGARERLEALQLGVALERRQPEHARLAVFILHRLEKLHLAGNDRAADRHTRGPRLDASELAAAAP